MKDIQLIQKKAEKEGRGNKEQKGEIESNLTYPHQ